MRNTKDDDPGAYVSIFANGEVPHEVALFEPDDFMQPLPFLPWPQVRSKRDIPIPIGFM